jgi:hypothetical protein
LTSISCDEKAKTLSKLESHSNYLEKEFEYTSQRITDNNNNNLAKWGKTYNKIVLLSKLVSEIEILLKKHGELNRLTYQKIDSFFISGTDKEIEAYFQKINQTELDNWKKEFKEGQSLTNIETELLLINILTVRNSLSKEYIENVERLYYKFPIISTIVDSESNDLKLGETYKAEVSITAYDPTIVPICEIKGVKTEVRNGRFYFEIPCNKKGTFNWKGTLNIPGPQGYYSNVFPIEGKYTVK